MKNILSIGLICAAAMSFTACVNEEDNLFDKSAAERLNEASELYSKRLTASPNGWAVQLYPTTDDEAPYGSGYLLLFRFHANKSVDAATYTYLKSSTAEKKTYEYLTDTSTWDVITDDGPVLTFNTYNKVVHLFSDPEDVACTGTAENSNDETGTGIGGDYEFIIVDAPEDASYMMLKGKKRGTYNLLTPVEEGVDYEEYLTDVRNFQNNMFASDAPTFNVLHCRNYDYKMTDASDGVPNIYPYGGDDVVDQEFNPFIITKKGSDYMLRFRDSKSYFTTAVVDSTVNLQEFKYVKDRDAFVATDHDDCYITGDDPVRFFNEQLSTSSSSWRWSQSSKMSDSYKAIITELVSQMAKVKYTFTRFAIYPQADNTFNLRFTYSYNRREYSVNLKFTWSETETGFQATYKGLADGSSDATLLKNFPALQNVINALSGDVKVGISETSFNLNYVRLTSASNADLWYDISLK